MGSTWARAFAAVAMRLRPTARAILMLTAFFVCVCPASAGQPRLYPVPKDIGRLSFDETHAVWQDSGGLHVVRDGRPWDSFSTFASPAGCGTFASAGAGSALFSCYPSEPGAVVPRLLDLDDGTITTPPLDGLMQSEDAESTAVGVGARLIDIVSGDSHGFGHSYLDRRTGRLFTAFVTARSVKSLDRPDGRRRLCAPLRVRTHMETDDSGDRFPVFDDTGYRPPYLVTLHGSDLILERCHTRTTGLLSKDALAFKVTRDYVAWTTRRQLFVRLFRTRRTLIYGLPSRGLAGVDGTRKTVVVFIHHALWGVDLLPRRAG